MSRPGVDPPGTAEVGGISLSAAGLTGVAGSGLAGTTRVIAQHHSRFRAALLPGAQVIGDNLGPEAIQIPLADPEQSYCLVRR